jgi:hypothetical protein
MTDSLCVLAGGDTFDEQRRAADQQVLSLTLCPLLDRLQRAARNGRWGKVRRLTLGYLNSETARLRAACRAAPSGATDAAVRELAATVDPFNRTTEQVRWRLKQKRSGSGSRHVCDLPPILKANHYLIKDVLVAVFDAPSHVFDVPGRGRDVAAHAVKAALEAGYNRCFLGDVRDCYQHVSADALVASLPLPRCVIENSLDFRNLTLVRSCAPGFTGASYKGGGSRANGPRGLLQGSPASNIVLAMLFSSLAPQIEPHDCTVINVSDNFFVAAKNDATLEAIIALLREYLHDHCAGPFELKHNSRTVEVGQDFEFIGYRFERSGDHVTIDIGEDRLAEFEDALEEALELDLARYDPRASEATFVIMQFLGGYRAASNWELRREDLLLEALDHVLYGGIEELFEHQMATTRRAVGAGATV